MKGSACSRVDNDRSFFYTDDTVKCNNTGTKQPGPLHMCLCTFCSKAFLWLSTFSQRTTATSRHRRDMTSDVYKRHLTQTSKQTKLKPGQTMKLHVSSFRFDFTEEQPWFTTRGGGGGGGGGGRHTSWPLCTAVILILLLFERNMTWKKSIISSLLQQSPNNLWLLGSGSSPVSWCDDHERDKSVWSCTSSWSSHHDTGRGPEHISRYLCNLKFVENNKLSEIML